MQNKFNHPLMEDNISKQDIAKVIKFLKKKPILTQNIEVEKFENQWSKWLGVKYSVFVPMLIKAVQELSAKVAVLEAA